MNNKSYTFLAICLSMCIHTLKAQSDRKFEFGEISAADFNQIIKNPDTAAHAIFLADVERVNFEKNEAGNYDIVYTRFLRAKIMNKNGYDAGKFAISLNKLVPYQSFFMKLPEPGLIKLRGVTYNLEEGVIHRTNLDMNSVFTENEGKLVSVKKFTMPGLKEGCLFEVEYSIRSAFPVQNINWTFQGKYPRLWSEYDLTLPDAYRYIIKYQGDSNFYIHTVDTTTLVSNAYSNTEKILASHFRWVKLNEPAIASEPYMSSWKNYADRVSFEHEWRVFSQAKYRPFNSSTWQGFSHIYFYLNGLEDFADEKHNWLNKELKEILIGLHTKRDIAAAIYDYVRDHFKCMHRNSYFATQSLKETFKEKSGNVADINLLLAAMLRHENIEADPAVLSTTDNGYGNLSYPLPADYNYLICVARLDNKSILLDASLPQNSFGTISPTCYNGGAIVLKTDSPRFELLVPDSLVESNRTNVIISSNEKSELTGSLTIFCGSQKSFAIRNQFKNDSLKGCFHDLLLNPQIKEISNEESENLTNPDKSLIVHCDIDFKDSPGTDLFYFNPSLLPYFDKNPLSNVTRKYAIEMPSLIDNVYLATIDIPKGYLIEEMPRSESFRLNLAAGSFDYILEKSTESLQLQIRMKLSKTYFTTDEYEELRTFFNSIIKKENEQIVFRKIK